MKVLLFARARELAGSDVVEVELPEGATVADVRVALVRRFPILATLMPHCAVAVNDEFADETLVVPVNASIALLPPVSGG